MELIKDPKLMQQRSNELRLGGNRIGFVPTMGALHEGHLSLVDTAKGHTDLVVMSIYLNPTQFNNKEDLATYPANLEKDLELARTRGVDIVFCPTDKVIYPKGFQTYVDTEDITRVLCGESRPGHFRGVTTVVLKLFNIVKPDVAVLGEKDYQQLKVIEQMVRDLNVDVKIVSSPIVREEDGIAMSSRNRRLSAEERQAARSINEALNRAKDAVKNGERDIGKIVAGVKRHIEATNIGKVDYVKICDAETLSESASLKLPALLAIAAYFGKTRLIDNCVL